MGKLSGVVAALAILTRLRHLIFESVSANVDGVAAIIARIPEMDGLAEQLKRDFATALDYWPLLFFASSVWSVVFVTLIGWWALSRVMSRLVAIPDVHKLESSADTGTIAPVPPSTRSSVRHPTAELPVGLPVA